jgi:hypothetical protein
MTRVNGFIVIGLLFAICGIPYTAEASHMAQYEVNSGVNPDSGEVIDPATTNILQVYTSYLQDAQGGTLQSPSGGFPTSWSLHVTNPDIFGVGDGTYIDVFYTGTAANFPTESYLKLFYDFNYNTTLHTTGSVDSATVVGGGSAFLVNLNTRPPLGTISLLSTLDGEVGPSQSGVILTGVQVNHEATSDPFPGGRFDVYAQLRLNPGGTVVPGARLMRISMTGEITPEPSTMALATMAVILMLIGRRPDAAVDQPSKTYSGWSMPGCMPDQFVAGELFSVSSPVGRNKKGVSIAKDY